jgi:hypothetical protein
MRSRCRARIYVRNRPKFANLPKMPNPDTKLLEKYFSHFAKKFRMPNLYAKLLEMTKKDSLKDMHADLHMHGTIPLITD